MPHSLSYERLNDDMVAAIPALRAAYVCELAWWEGDVAPAHVAFGAVFNPYLSQKLATRDEQALKDVFAFMERMASDSDPRVRDVLRDTVLEHIRDEAPPQRQLAADLMGSATGVHWRAVADR